MINVSIAPTPISEKPMLASMMVRYQRELDASTGNAKAEPADTQPDQFFDLYWTDSDRWPFFVLTNDLETGFALVRRVGGRPENLFEIAEFFISPASRRSGIGTNAAHMLFDRFPGSWRVSQLINHEAATTFWRTAIDAYTQGAYTEDIHPDEQRGYRQNFQSDHNREGKIS